MLERIGPFEVIRELGRGGMGVVYLARDGRLDRDVAIKTLPVELASDPTRLERFEREARTLAQLNHPNLAGIHGVEERDGARYLVLEYVEGESLADRLDRGPLPVDEAVEYAVQIAAGLEAAHDAGVIHRDLKPANVMITPDGRAKVLDFGLARADDGGQSFGGGLDSPTMTVPQPQHSPTIAGAILGTAAYMSPEQARGRQVDTRTDIWSFGVVLYEMLVGASPFHGETATDSIGAVLHKAFSIEALPEGTPRMVRHVLRRCLERDKTRRLQSIGDVRVELQEVLERRGTEDDDELGTAGAGRGSWTWPALAVVFAISTLAISLLWLLGPTSAADSASSMAAADRGAAPPTVLRIEQITDSQGQTVSAAISPKASTVAYSERDADGDTQINRMRIGGMTPFVVNRERDVFKTRLAYSPDGDSIAYASFSRPRPASRGVFVMGATGENPRRLVEAPAWDPAWSPDGRLVAYTTSFWTDPNGRSEPGELWIVDVTTRERRMVDTTEPAVRAGGWSSDAVSPAFSPDGSRLAYWGMRNGVRDIFTVSVEGGDVVRITDDVHLDWNPVWSPDGRAIWFLSDRGGQPGIWWIPVAEDGRPAGEPRPIVIGTGRILSFSRSSDGRSIVARVLDRRTRIQRFPFDPEAERLLGSPETLIESSTEITNPDISRDGEWIAFQSGSPQQDITVMRLDGTERRRLTEDVAQDRDPMWSSDGRSLSFYSNRDGEYRAWTVGRDSAETRRLEFGEALDVVSVSFSPDGTKARLATRDSGLRIADLDDEGGLVEERPVTEALERGPGTWSPDGRWIIELARRSSVMMEGADVYCVALDTETDAVVVVTDPDGAAAPWFATLSWIDESRLLVRARAQDPAFIFDVSTGESRWTELTVDREVRFITYLDGLLYLLRSDDVTNLWLVSLDETAWE
jgi:serine/threonine protein kinase/WD40 repeat protein